MALKQAAVGGSRKLSAGHPVRVHLKKALYRRTTWSTVRTLAAPLGWSKSRAESLKGQYDVKREKKSRKERKEN